MAPPEPLTRSDYLGWSALRRLLAGLAATTVGRDAALALEPSRTLATVTRALTGTTEARRARELEGDPPWAGVRDLRPILAEVEPAGAKLDGPSLVQVGQTLRAASRLVAYARRIRGAAPTLAEAWHDLPSLDDLGARLEHDLDPDGRLRDEASPRLKTLRRQVADLRNDLQSRLERLLDNPAVVPLLQDRYVTVRNGRYVLPIRDEARRGFRGIIHDRSLSGATVFVEPEAVIDLNNQLTQRMLEEEAEVDRLLRELTRQVRLVRPELVVLVDGLGQLDLAFARGLLAERLDAVEPVVAEGGDLDLPDARHPLLVAQTWTDPGRPPVVPMDLRLTADRPGLVISGPNAGGKTVALEAFGLLVLMAHAGCHVPCAPGSRLPLTEEVLAVIGDDQSLAQNLSTFSSFVAQVRSILDVAGPATLVLLDELGAGTDPAEGAALGAALLDALLARGARVVATTHLEPLKVFAQTEPRLRNAMVAFDPERLAPTFHLLYDRPGPSYALAIGERFGLPGPVIARARQHLTETARRLETLLAELDGREREASDRLAEAARREAAAARALAEAEARLAAVERETEARRRAVITEARTVLADARRQAGHELERLKAEDAGRRDAQLSYQRLREAERLLAPPAGRPALEAGAPIPASVPGGEPAQVEILGLGVRGRIVREDAGMVTVQAGSFTVRVPRSEVVAAGAAPRPARPRPAVSLPAREDVGEELHLRGLVTDEARGLVEKFLDDAAMAGHATVRLVHGKGTGALRRAVEQCLRGHPLVAGFRLAPPREGGDGVTVVQMVEGSGR